jgi:hypothetical protein
MFQERGVKVDFVDEAAWIENTTLAFHVDDDEDNADHGSRFPAAIFARFFRGAFAAFVDAQAACSATTLWCTRTALRYDVQVNTGM